MKPLRWQDSLASRYSINDYIKNSRVNVFQLQAAGVEVVSYQPLGTIHLRLKESEWKHFYQDPQLDWLRADVSGRLIPIYV